jgi:penicillin-binding protein 1A
VWVGYDEKRTLGNNEEGARVALPIWIEFLKAYIEDQSEPAEFMQPDNIVFASVDPLTGQMTESGSRGAILEAFIAGTEPGTVFQR